MVDCAGYTYSLARLFDRAYLPFPLFSHADFITENPQYVAPNNAMNFLSDNGGANYNLCHCTSMPSLLILHLKEMLTNK